MEMARVAPDRVPVDILLRLSRYDEDWYVQAPANAALKTIAHAVPGVLRIFFDRLKSENCDEREHAASQLYSISNIEPEILNKEALASALRELTKREDSSAKQILAKTVANVRNSEHKTKYKYGL